MKSAFCPLGPANPGLPHRKQIARNHDFSYISIDKATFIDYTRMENANNLSIKLTNGGRHTGPYSAVVALDRVIVPQPSIASLELGDTEPG